MPSQIIHVLAGSAAFEASGISLADFCPPAFRLGCQGPDIFSHNRRTRPFALAYSRLLHRHDYGAFCRNLVSLPGFGNSSVFLSWLYGLVTHQIVDRLLHPWIVYRSFLAGPTGYTSVSPAHFHAFLERILDVCLLDSLKGLPVTAFDTGLSFHLDDEQIREISGPVAAALVETYPAESSDTADIRLRTENAFADALYFYDLTNPLGISVRNASGAGRMRPFIPLGPSGVALLHPEHPDPAVDWLNLSGSAWAHPVSGEPSTSSVPDLFVTAVSQASEILVLASGVSRGIVSPGEFGIAVGNGSLSVSGTDGQIGAVRFADPFNLERVLREETDRRRSWLGMDIC